MSSAAHWENIPTLRAENVSMGIKFLRQQLPTNEFHRVYYLVYGQ